MSDPIVTGTVSTPAQPQQPKGWLWDRLAEANDDAQVTSCAAVGARLGYAPGGQFFTAVGARLGVTAEEAHALGAAAPDPRDEHGAWAPFTTEG